MKLSAHAFPVKFSENKFASEKIGQLDHSKEDASRTATISEFVTVLKELGGEIAEDAGSRSNDDQTFQKGLSGTDIQVLKEGLEATYSLEGLNSETGPDLSVDNHPESINPQLGSGVSSQPFLRDLLSGLQEPQYKSWEKVPDGATVHRLKPTTEASLTQPDLSANADSAQSLSNDILKSSSRKTIVTIPGKSSDFKTGWTFVEDGGVQAKKIFVPLAENRVASEAKPSGYLNPPDVLKSSIQKNSEFHQAGMASSTKSIPVSFIKPDQTVFLSDQKVSRVAMQMPQLMSLALTKQETFNSIPDFSVPPSIGGETKNVPVIKPAEISDFVRSLISDIKQNAKFRSLAVEPAGSSTASLKTYQVNLYPRELGVVEINIKSAGDNISISIKAQTQAALTLIQGDLDAIQKSIQATGQVLDDIQLGRLASNLSLSEQMKHDQALGEEASSRAHYHTESGQNDGQDDANQDVENRAYFDFQAKNDGAGESADSRKGIYM